LGGKVSAKVIRTGAERAILEAAFVLSADLIAWLNQEEIELLEEPTLLCSREITAKSTRTRVNGVVINRQQSQALREMLVEITAQGQTILLSRSDAQRDWLDSFGGAALWQQRQIVAELYAQKERSHRLWQERQQNERQRLQHLDMLRYQLRELENAHLVDPTNWNNWKRNGCDWLMVWICKNRVLMCMKHSTKMIKTKLAQIC